MYGAIAVGFFAAVFGGRARRYPARPVLWQWRWQSLLLRTHRARQKRLRLRLWRVSSRYFWAYARRPLRSIYADSVISGFMSGIGVIIILSSPCRFWRCPSPRRTLSHYWRTSCRIDISELERGRDCGDDLACSRSMARSSKALFTSDSGGARGWRGYWRLLVDRHASDWQCAYRVPSLQLPELSTAFLLGAIQPAITIALLGSIDSLLTSLIADSQTRGRHKPNRELFGQGIGNVAAALVGGIPGAGNTLGTVLNIREPGTTRLSGALCSVILLIVVLGLGKYSETIPHAVLAGILMKVGWDIIRLAIPDALPSRSARTPSHHVHHADAYGIPRPHHCGRYRSYSGRHGERASIRAHGA